MGAAGDGFVGDGLVGEGGRAMRSSISEMDGADKMRDCDRYAPNSLFGNTGRWWWLVWAVTVTEAGELVTFFWTGE